MVEFGVADLASFERCLIMSVFDAHGRVFEQITGVGIFSAD